MSRPGQAPRDRTTSGLAQRQGSQVPTRRGPDAPGTAPAQGPQAPRPKERPPAPYQMDTAKGATPITRTMTPSTRRRASRTQTIHASRLPAPLLPNRRGHIHHRQQPKIGKRATQCTLRQPPTPSCRRRSDARQVAAKDHHARHKPNAAPPQAPKTNRPQTEQRTPAAEAAGATTRVRRSHTKQFGPNWGPVWLRQEPCSWPLHPGARDRPGSLKRVDLVLGGLWRSRCA